MPRNHKTAHRAINFDGEGYREKSFGEYLVSLYHVPNRRIKVTSAYGGSPAYQIGQIIAQRSWRAFDEEHAIYDTDRDDIDEARRLIKSDGNKIVPHESEGSIDYELLKLLTDDKKILKKARQSTKAAKAELKKICKLKKEDGPINWSKYYPKSLLDAKRKTSPWLDGLIRIITG